jgi:hypothetical protein
MNRPVNKRMVNSLITGPCQGMAYPIVTSDCDQILGLPIARMARTIITTNNAAAISGRKTISGHRPGRDPAAP